MKPLSDEARNAAEAYFVTPRSWLAPEALFSAIQVLERMMKNPNPVEWGELLMLSRETASITQRAISALAGFRQPMPSVFSSEMADFICDHWMVSLSVSFALDKLTMLQLGIITAPGGDLRKAEFLPPLEQTLNLLRWKEYREVPARFSNAMAEAVRKSDFSFFRDLSTVLTTDGISLPAWRANEPETECAPRGATLLQEILLNAWACPKRDSKGQLTLPLCYLKDRPLSEYLSHLRSEAVLQNRRGKLPQNISTSRGLRMVWQRLGLRRSEFAIIKKGEFLESRRSSGCFVLKN